MEDFTKNGTVHVYHGSKYKFDDFCFDNVGTEGGIDGASYGLYFSESKAEALTYGDNVYTCNLLLKNPLSNTAVTLDINKVRQMINYLKKHSDYSYIKLSGGDDNDNVDIDYYAYYLFEALQSDTDLVKEFIDTGCEIQAMMDMLKHFDYTHTIDKITPNNETITHYICYDCSAIKIIQMQNIEEI